MRHLSIFILLLFCCSSIKAQSKEISDTYELSIKDQKILDALSICFSNFDNYVKNYKHYVFKVFLTYHSQDDLEMTIDYFTPKDTIQYTQPDHYFKYEDRIAFVYNGENLLTKIYDHDFQQYILSVCREKMELSNLNMRKNSKPIETNKNTKQSSVNTARLDSLVKTLPKPSDLKVVKQVRVVHVDPTLKYSIRKIKDKVEITGLRSATI